MRIFALLFFASTLFAQDLFLGFFCHSQWRQIGITSIYEDLQTLAPNSEDSLFIDNIHRFHDYPEYGLSPSLSWIQAEILKINPAYQFYVVGNSAIIYLNRDLIPTELVKACTVSRLFQDEDPVEAVLAAEKIIRSQAHVPEARNFDRWVSLILSDPTKGAATVHFLLWKGLVEMGRNHFKEAILIFDRIRSIGYPHWRITWYLADCCFRVGERDYARELAQEVLAEVPHFIPAKRLL